MSGSYSQALVVLSVSVAIFASYVALAVAGRVREATGRLRVLWVAGGALAMGVGIWSMHFIGMLALRLPVAVAYNVWLWLLSALVAIAASAMALALAARAAVSTAALAMASLLMGGAIAGMHYLGMAAMHIAGRIDYRAPVVAASVAVAVAASFVALLLVFRLRSDETRGGRLLRVGAAVVMGFAVAGMHYTGMAAARFWPSQGGVAVHDRHLLATSGLAGAVAMGTAILLLVALAAVMVDRELRRRGRQTAEMQRLYAEAEAARREARKRAERAEELAAELQRQAHHVEEQAAELEATNDELQAAEARTRAILDSSLEAIVSTDPNSVIIDWNRRAEELFGWPADEALGRTLAEVMIPERYRAAHQRGVEHYLATGEGPILNRRIEIEALRRDGSEFPVELAVSPAHWGNKLIFSSFIRDLSLQKLAEGRVRAEHDVVRVLAESHSYHEAAPRVLQAIGAALGWEVGVFWAVNPRDEFLRFVALWHDPAVEVREFEMAAHRVQFRCGVGLPGRVWESRTATWLEDIALDDNFPRAPAALKAGLRSAVAFPVLSGQECLGVIEFYNEDPLRPDDAMLAMLAALGAGVGESMRRIRAEEDRDRAMQHMETANAELARRGAEAERARVAADQANRAKSEFLATMSHELRTPLNAILGYADLMDLQIAGPLSAGQRDQLGRIQASGRHLLALIEDVLDLARIEAGRLGLEHGTARVAAVVGDALTLVEPQAAARAIRLENRCEDTALQYAGDENRVRQILLNLLGNAVKFTGSDGRVTVTCGVAEPGQGPTGSSGLEPSVYIAVTDTGIGIAAEELERVFEPFVQAEMGHTRTHGGTGLGLTISRRLARLMGGELTLSSEPGRGSTFRLWLPAPGAERQVAEAPVASLGSSSLALAGVALRDSVDEVLRRVTARLRNDPALPMAHGLDDADLEDHQATLLMDVAQTLVILSETASDPLILRDGSDVQQLIAARHGRQRARLGWTETAMRCEYQITQEQVLRAVEERLPSGQQEAMQQAAPVLRRLIEAALRNSLVAMREAASARQP